MKPVVLFRNSLELKTECLIANYYFDVTSLRTKIKSDDLVICRYSASPFYGELVQDIQNLGGKVIQTWEEYNWIASFAWYNVLREFTPESWFDHNFWRARHSGPFVVKGRTTSYRHNWNKLMYAETKSDAVRIAGQISQDPDIHKQGIVYRKYEKLKSRETGVNGLPFADEWRFFFHKEYLLTYGYYWNIAESIPAKASLPPEAVTFARSLASIASQYTTFFALDIAQTEDGRWILIEVNDGQCSGLSCCDPEDLYSNLWKVVCDEYKIEWCGACNS